MMAAAEEFSRERRRRTKVGEKKEIRETKKTPKDQGLLVRACLSVMMEKQPGLF
jgi:hypothetical protein